MHSRPISASGNSLIEKMSGRHEELISDKNNDEFMESLGANPKLREFLEQALHHLNGWQNRASEHKSVAHFLMGRASPHELPKDLAEWVNKNNFQPTPDLEKHLDNLLQTSRYGLIPEKPEKTRAKLEFLSDQIETIARQRAFPDDGTGQFPTEKVEQWMFGESNPWFRDSDLKSRNKGGFQPTTNIDDLRPLGNDPISAQIHIHVGKITDLKAKPEHKACIVINSAPNLLLCNGNETAKEVAHAAGGEPQADLFRKHGLPFEKGMKDDPPNLKVSDNRIYSASCTSGEMKDTHGIDSLCLINSTTIPTQRNTIAGPKNTTKINCTIVNFHTEQSRCIIMSAKHLSDDTLLPLLIADQLKNSPQSKKIILVVNDDNERKKLNEFITLQLEEAKNHRIESDSSKNPPEYA